MTEQLTKEAWSERYRAGDTGWDKGRAAPPISRMLAEGHLPAGTRIAVLGAGRGHEAIAAARAGYVGVAIDFAPEATAAAEEAGQQESLAVEVLTRDVFELPRTHAKAFGAALEHTSFCAIDPDRKAEYARMVAALLPPGGIYFGLFYAHERPGGPPFATDSDEVRALFEPFFIVRRLVIAPDSFPQRAGAELEFVFVRKPE